MPSAPHASASPRIAIVGAGASGYFAAVQCARDNPSASVCLYERGRRGLAKVLASGGGRCNLSHACFEPSELCAHYPRGSRELLGPFYAFGARDALDWFAAEHVPTKTEADGRIFPASDVSGSVAHALENAARSAGVRARFQAALTALAPQKDGGFKLWFNDGEFSEVADAVLLACGGLRDSAGLRRIVADLGHTIIPPLPSLFAFKCQDARLRGLAGASVPDACVRLEGETFSVRGALLITHRGFSGPAALRLSAWRAQALAKAGYRGALCIGWLGDADEGALNAQFARLRAQHPKRRVAAHSPFEQIPLRLWARLCAAAGVADDTEWNALAREKAHALARETARGVFAIEGRAQNRDEFVTCGGVALNEVGFKTMASRKVPDLYFAGELLDIDAETGGFNLQAAWTTGFLAGKALARTIFHPNLC